MDEMLKTVATHVVTFAGGYLSRYVEPRAKLVHWFPGWVTFAVQLPAPPAGAAGAPPGAGSAPAGNPGNFNVSTHTLTVQNTGWRPATQVEIVHGQAPQLFRFTPPINFTQGTTPAGEHVITIGALAPREWVALHVLTVGPFPPLRSVRSTEGASTQVSTRQTFVLSRTRRIVQQGLVWIGAATAAYWLWRIATRAVPPAWDFLRG